MSNISASFRRLVPAAVSLLLFFVVSALYFAPQFGGEVLPQHDALQYEGMSREIVDARQRYGEDPQWTGAMFGGMPAYLISIRYPAQLVKESVGRAVRLVDTPAGFLFFAMTAMWAMLLLMGVGPWTALVGGLAYGLSTYFVLIVGAGHVAKMWAAVYAPLMMGGIWTVFRGDPWRGAVLTALFASLELGANHPQITYYFLLAAACFWVSEAVVAGCKRAWRPFLKRTAVALGAGLLAVGSNFAPLWYTATHTRATMRGGSEQAAAAGDSAGGLDLTYATAWSYGRSESWNLLIPDFMGGDSGRGFSSDGAVAAALTPYGMTAAAEQLPAYWGDQPYTAGPTYLGAVAVFLAVLGLFLVDGRDKWWLLAASLLALLLAWGHHFMGFTELAFRYLPGYNKFRAVSTTLVVMQWSVPLLAALALARMTGFRDGERPRLQRALAWAAGLTGGACLLFAVAGGGLFDFGREAGIEQMTDQFGRMLQASGGADYLSRGLHEQLGDEVGNAMADERAAIMASDAWRSLGFIAAAGVLLLLGLRRRLPSWGVTAGIVAMVAVDLWSVDRRYLSDDDFVSPSRRRIVATEADRAILRDTTLGFRVFNLTVSPFNDATTSYFHRSVGGYHGAKLARYQDLIDRYLSQGDPRILDMLNTRYEIRPAQQGVEAVLRPTASGPAWFVSRLEAVPTAAAELDALATVDLRTTAVVSDADAAAFALPAGAIGRASGDPDAEPRIRLTEYRPNYLRYEYEAEEDGVAVFSEIYYDGGWTASIDGVEAPYFRADYLLRAMRLPAGSHRVEWRFRAPHWGLVEGITLVSSLAVLAGAVWLSVREVRRRRKAGDR